MCASGDQEVGGSRRGSDRSLDDFHVRSEPVAQALHAFMLGLDRDDPSAECVKNRAPRSQVGADVEAQVPRRDELSIERPGPPCDPGSRSFGAPTSQVPLDAKPRHPPCRP